MIVCIALVALAVLVAKKWGETWFGGGTPIPAQNPGEGGSTSVSPPPTTTPTASASPTEETNGIAWYWWLMLVVLLVGLVIVFIRRIRGEGGGATEEDGSTVEESIRHANALASFFIAIEDILKKTDFTLEEAVDAAEKVKESPGVNPDTKRAAEWFQAFYMNIFDSDVEEHPFERFLAHIYRETGGGLAGAYAAFEFYLHYEKDFWDASQAKMAKKVKDYGGEDKLVEFANEIAQDHLEYMKSYRDIYLKP